MRPAAAHEGLPTALPTRRRPTPTAGKRELVQAARAAKRRKVAAEILKSLKTSVESYLQEEVKEAVVSVPAYFGPTEREATERAANIAGLSLLR